MGLGMKRLPGHVTVNRGFDGAGEPLDHDRRRGRRRRWMVAGACVLAVPVVVAVWFVIGVNLMAIV